MRYVACGSVMEIFVFIRTGGKRISVKLLDESDSALAARLVHFDAAKAECFLDRDKQRLWAVIEAAFGNFAPFNKIVRGLVAEKLDKAVLARASARLSRTLTHTWTRTSSAWTRTSMKVVPM